MIDNRYTDRQIGENNIQGSPFNPQFKASIGVLKHTDY